MTWGCPISRRRGRSARSRYPSRLPASPPRGAEVLGNMHLSLFSIFPGIPAARGGELL